MSFIFKLALFVAVGAGSRGTTSAAEPDARAPSTVRMAERLEQIARTTHPMEVRFQAAGQVVTLRNLFAVQPEKTNDPALRFQLAESLLNSGRNLESLAEFKDFERSQALRGTPLSGENKLNVRLNEALCHLREAERINCLSNHNADSCLLPLRDGGIHRWQESSRQAIQVLTNLLVEFPDNLAARWLLNVAAMTVGDYPAKVPARWLIPPAVFASDVPFPRFRDIAPGLGLAPNELSGGSVVDDFDGDELLDVMVTSIGLHDQMHFYRNNGDGTFTERTREAGLLGLVGGLNMVTADFDNDGWLDVLVLRGAWMKEEGRYPNSLLRNRGDGTFADVTEQAGLLTLHPKQTAAWFDFDGDGWLDLFVGNETIPGGPLHPCELYRNQGNGTFKEIAKISGVTVRNYVKGVVAGDFNNDGRPDLYVSILGAPNRLFRNDGPRDAKLGGNGGWIFTDVAEEAGVTEPINSFPCWFFDYDNDGWQDIFVSGYKIKNVGDVAADYLGLPHTGAKARLYRNRGDGTFSNVTAQVKLDRVLHAMGSNFGDLDNDGWLDFYLGTGDPDLLTVIPNRMFRNAEGRVFQDVTTAGGFGHLQKGHGVSFADLDNDGDQDVYEDMGGAMTGDVYPNVLYENPGFGNHWLKLRLQGVRANRSAIGARVRVDVEEQGRVRSLHRTVGSGGSFGANPLRLEVGLGKATRIVMVEIIWPGSGTRQQLHNLEMDRGYRVVEGDPKPQPMTLKTFKFATDNPHAHHHH
ncbi:MAG TPA: CRTAC1 family protein [Candidatus Saccharimonadales bacterium]|nr:CRTAC1 family protein [Candidatus Saccharimonadales bacterium]